MNVWISKLILSPVNIENNEIYTFYCELFWNHFKTEQYWLTQMFEII